MLAYALHAIHLKRGDKAVVQEPKAVFECASEAQFEELKALGAVREPTEAERALHALVNPSAGVSAPPETAAQRKKREKAEAEAAAAAQAADDAAAAEAARLAADDFGDQESFL